MIFIIFLINGSDIQHVHISLKGFMFFLFNRVHFEILGIKIF